MIFLQLFYTFFKIGLFGFGGGYAMLSMIQGEVVTRHDWLSPQEFTDIVAISQMTPGPIGINSATYVGYDAIVNAGYGVGWGIFGSVLATLAVVLPSFLLMLTISAALVLMNVENFGSPTEDTRSFLISCAIFLVAFIGTRRYKVNPILMIVLCGVAGVLLY